MTDSAKLLVAWFAGLQSGGFRRKSLVWCKESSETLFSFELQRSKHSDCYFVNVGVLLQSGKHHSQAPPHRCHFFGRFGSASANLALDFEAACEERDTILRTFQAEELLPAAARCATREGAVTFFHSGALEVPLVAVSARELLGLPPLEQQ